MDVAKFFNAQTKIMIGDFNYDTTSLKRKTMKKILFMCIAVLFCACQSSKQNVSVANYDDGEMFSLVENMVKEERIVKLSELVDDYRIIQFEDKDEAFFKSNWMYFSKKYILVKQSRDSFKLFNKTGDFLGNIGSYGQGPGEYQSVYDAVIDEENKIVYIVPLVGNSIYKYNLSGIFLGKIELEERINKGRIFLQSNNILSMTQLCFKDLDEKYTSANIFLEYPDSIQYVYAESLVSNMKNVNGQRDGFNNEIWSYRNVDNFAFMMTHTDTLFHYDSQNNQIKARLTMSIDEDKIKDGFVILNELPKHYLITITGKSERHILVEKETKIAYKAKFVNDYMGNLEVSPRFQDGYFFCNMEPGFLKEKIEGYLCSGNNSDEQREQLNQLASSLEENDNNILLLGKLKK